MAFLKPWFRRTCWGLVFWCFGFCFLLLPISHQNKHFLNIVLEIFPVKPSPLWDSASSYMAPRLPRKSFFLCPPRREWVLQPQRLRLCLLLQHTGRLQVRLPLRIFLWPVLQCLPRRQRVLVLQEPVQLWLLQHGRGLPVRLPARVLQSGTGVRPPPPRTQGSRCGPGAAGKWTVVQSPGGKSTAQRT